MDGGRGQRRTHFTLEISSIRNNARYFAGQEVKLGGRYGKRTAEGHHFCVLGQLRDSLGMGSFYSSSTCIPFSILCRGAISSHTLSIFQSCGALFIQPNNPQRLTIRVVSVIPPIMYFTCTTNPSNKRPNHAERPRRE